MALVQLSGEQAKEIEKEVIPVRVNVVSVGTGMSGIIQSEGEQFTPDPLFESDKKMIEAEERQMDELFGGVQHKTVNVEHTVVQTIAKIMAETSPVLTPEEMDAVIKIRQEKQQVVSIVTSQEVVEKFTPEITADNFVTVSDDGTTKTEVQINTPDDSVRITVNRQSIEELQNQYVKLESVYRDNKKILEDMDKITMLMIGSVGVDHHWQDEESKAIFQIVDRFEENNVAFQTQHVSRFHIIHTIRKEYGEKRGDLSAVKARTLGYKV